MTTRQETASVRTADAADQASTFPNAPEPAAAMAADRPRQEVTSSERRITLIALMIVFMLSALDSTIVSTAMPKIVAQLSGLELYSWVTTAYLLSSTVMVPIYGKLSDIYGRKPILLIGMSIFIAGSMLCGMAGEFGTLPIVGGGMTQLIVCRAIQGIGGGALFTSAFAIIADLFPPRERGKMAGLFGSVFGVATVLGPPIGGFFTDLDQTSLFGIAIAGWRWVFYCNLPVAGVAFFMVVAKMPQLTHKRPGKIDFIGAALIVATCTPLLLALTWGGDRGWTSPLVVELFVGAAVGLGLFIWAEAKATNPILSLKLFTNRVFSTANVAGFFTSMAFMGMVTFLPLYLQLGQGAQATVSGMTLTPLMIGLIISSVISGQVVARTGKYKPAMIVGSCFIIAGAVALVAAGAHAGPLDMTWRIVILGLGLGPSQSLYNIAVQNALPLSEVGVATGANQFFRQIGSTIGVAVFGAVLSHSLAAETARAPHPPGVAVHAMKLSDLERMNIQMQAQAKKDPAFAAAMAKNPVVQAAVQSVKDMVSRSVHQVMIAGLFVTLIAFGCVLLIPALPLQGAYGSFGKGAKKPDDAVEAAAIAPSAH